MKIAVKVRVTGIVQGVGFRPFVHRVAIAVGVDGYVRNLGGSEVEIHVEGHPDTVSEFIARLVQEKPPPALLELLEIEETRVTGIKGFKILKSGRSVTRRSMIPPDISICCECLREIHDPNTRFYMYYWNSCAWCGPRFSMMYSIPYDRENTSMRAYKLCRDCERDYHDPDNVRRFHAQGISCPRCGPRTYVYTSKGEKLDVDDPLSFTVRVIEEGSIVAIKGVGGFHIAALASRDDVVAELRRRKKRPQKPFALMVRDLEVAAKLVILSEEAARVLQSPQRPILLLPRRDDAPVSELVAPGLDTLGIMLPYTGFQYLLLERVRDGFLIMTSGNIHGRPMCTTLECVFTELRDVVDYVVAHDREIVHRVDDSVLRFTDGDLVMLRRARGYAPIWLRTPFELVESVAVGAELQTAGAVGFEDKIVLTQYIGDLDEPAHLDDLERELRWFINVYNVRPRVVVADMHPFYANRKLAVRLAEEYGAELVEVQHHHAHAVSVLVDYHVPVDEERVAVTIDGVGYGLDGSVWGGEVLVAGYTRFRRVGRLHRFPLPGGDLATVYPIRSLIGLMYSCGYSEDEIVEVLADLGLLGLLKRGELEARVIYRQASSPRTITATSMGRTLDAFSTLLRVCTQRTYEGEPAMKLEAAARGGHDLGFTPKVKVEDGMLVVDTCTLLDWVLSNIDKPRNSLALTIQKGLGRALGEIAARYAIGDAVYASGGAAVNNYIVRGMRERLSQEKLVLRLPKSIPPNDGGIAVGQIAIASAIKQYG